MSNQVIGDINYLKMKGTKTFMNFSPESIDSKRLYSYLKTSNFFGKIFFDKKKLLFHHFFVSDS